MDREEVRAYVNQYCRLRDTAWTMRWRREMTVRKPLDMMSKCNIRKILYLCGL